MSPVDLQVWVLAASTGGIDAVAKFLSLVPCAQHVALVYVQHLVEQQHGHLLNIIRRNCDWPVAGVNYGSPMKGGQVVIPSADERFDIGEDGLIGVTDGEGWKLPYRPNIDDVSLQIGQYYGERAGIIIFTGMGNDGCRGSVEITNRGGRVWIQAPETCAAVSMPQAVLGRLTPDVLAGVEELAEKFNREISRGQRLAATGEKS